MNQKLSDVQAGFRKGRGTKDQIGSNIGKPTFIGSYYNIHVIMMELLSCSLLYCPLSHCILTVILILWLSVVLFTPLIVMILTTNHMNYQGKEEGREGRGGWREERKEGTKKEIKHKSLSSHAWKRLEEEAPNWKSKRWNLQCYNWLHTCFCFWFFFFAFWLHGCSTQHLRSLTRKWTHSRCVASIDS